MRIIILALALIIVTVIAPVAEPQKNLNPANSLYQGLIAYWDLDESSGNRAAAFQAGSLTLTDTNTVTQGTGKIGAAGQFTAANTEYLTIADNASLSMGDIDFTLACWINLDTLPASGGGAYGILEKFTPAGEREYDLDIQDTTGTPTYRFVFAVRDVADLNLTIVQASTFGTPSTATWYFLVAHHDSVNNQIGISVNNGTTDTTATTGGVRDGAAPFRVGAFGDASNAFNGRIDAVMVWKRLLTAAEKTYLYNSGNGRAPLGPDWASWLFLLWISPEILRRVRHIRSRR